MKKIATIVGAGLLVWLLTANALGDSHSAFLNTTWVGAITFVDSDGNIVTDNSTLRFTNESGDFLAAAFSAEGFSDSPVLFSCIRNGETFLMTAKGYLMLAGIYKERPSKKGSEPVQTMTIHGSSIIDGSMFQGTLIKE